MTDCTTVQPSHPTFLDDEITALALQLEELGVYSENSKGKHPANKARDVDVAFASFQAELEAYNAFLIDHRLAESIGNAVHTDGALIAGIVSQDIQCQEDRRAAVQMSNDDPEIEAAPRSVCDEMGTEIQDWVSSISGPFTGGSTTVVDFSDDETEAGPSMSYAERQAEVLGKFSMQFQCANCLNQFPVTLMVAAKCSHRYCIECMKRHFMLSTKDENLFPPRCCKQHIPLSLVSKHLSATELASFELASVEFTTDDRVYCSNVHCRRFIHPLRIDVGKNRAPCEDCGQNTCSLCKNMYHDFSDCPDDPALRETRELARKSGWQTCYNCNRVVILRSGCNHMTCRCKAQFCYVCGEKWKTCGCPTADVDRIEERAEEVVDRHAPPDLPRAERRRRIQEVQAELEENHECEHPGRFQRLFNTGGGPLACEMCGARHWKYILQCRRCFIDVCEECRRYRV